MTNTLLNWTAIVHIGVTERKRRQRRMRELGVISNLTPALKGLLSWLPFNYQAGTFGDECVSNHQQLLENIFKGNGLLGKNWLRKQMGNYWDGRGKISIRGRTQTSKFSPVIFLLPWDRKTSRTEKSENRETTFRLFWDDRILEFSNSRRLLFCKGSHRRCSFYVAALFLSPPSIPISPSSIRDTRVR